MLQIIVDGCTIWQSSEVHEPGPIAILDAMDAAPSFSTIAKLPQEAFAVLALDGGNKPIGPARIVTLGLLNQNQVHPREVFADPLKDRAASIIVAHNHPSGATDPSPEDIAITKRLVAAGKLLGIPVLDHLILTPAGKVTSLERGVTYKEVQHDH